MSNCFADCHKGFNRTFAQKFITISHSNELHLPQKRKTKKQNIHWPTFYRREISIKIPLAISLSLWEFKRKRTDKNGRFGLQEIF